MPEYIPNYSNGTNEIPFQSQDDVDKLIDMVIETNKVLQSRGFDSGCVELSNYLLTGNVTCFTRVNGIRDMAESIPYPEILFKVQAKLVKNSVDLAIDGATLTNNEIMNAILSKAMQDVNNPVPEGLTGGMLGYLDDIISNCKNSDVIINALMKRVTVIKKTQDPKVLSDSVRVLEEYASFIGEGLTTTNSVNKR